MREKIAAGFLAGGVNFISKSKNQTVQ